MTYFLVAAALVSGVAAWTDWRTGNIPNWLTYGTLGAGLIAHFVRGALFDGLEEGGIQVLLSIAGAGLCLLVPGVLYWKKGIGGGDVKLFAAIGVLCHPLGGLEAETYAFVAAAFIAPARLAYEGTLLRTLRNTVSMILNPLRRKEQRKEVPAEMLTWFRLGPSIFIGTLATAIAHWDLG